MTGLLLSREDLDFQLYDWLEAESLLSAPRFAAHSRETFDAVIDSCERLGGDVLLPCHALSDREEPGFDGEAVRLPDAVVEAVRALAASGLVTPWIAALGMAGSSLVVTLNALRLARLR